MKVENNFFHCENECTIKYNIFKNKVLYMYNEWDITKFNKFYYIFLLYIFIIKMRYILLNTTWGNFFVINSILLYFYCICSYNRASVYYAIIVLNSGETSIQLIKNYELNYISFDFGKKVQISLFPTTSYPCISYISTFASEIVHSI